MDVCVDKALSCILYVLKTVYDIINDINVCTCMISYSSYNIKCTCYINDIITEDMISYMITDMISSFVSYYIEFNYDIIHCPMIS